MYEKIDNQRRLTHEVADRIRTLIRSEKLRPGEKLPNEMELCRLFGVSRPTVREAVKSLVSQNIIEIVRGKGTFVSKNPGVASDPLGLDFITDDTLHLSLIEARLLIEPPVARLAAEKASDADVERVGALVQEMAQVVDRHAVDMSTELEFHRSIAAATGNPVIMRIVPVILDSIIKTYKDYPRTSEDHREAFQEHAEIYKGIRGRDPEAAAAAMRRHLQKSYERTLRKRRKPARRA